MVGSRVGPPAATSCLPTQCHHPLPALKDSRRANAPGQLHCMPATSCQPLSALGAGCHDCLTTSMPALVGSRLRDCVPCPLPLVSVCSCVCVRACWARPSGRCAQGGGAGAVCAGAGHPQVCVQGCGGAGEGGWWGLCCHPFCTCGGGGSCCRLSCVCMCWGVERG